MYNEIVSTITLLSIGFVAYHLRQRIKALETQVSAQKQLLSSYNDYIKVLDWKAVKEHYEEFKIPAEREKLTKINEDTLAEANRYWQQMAEFWPHIMIDVLDKKPEDRSAYIKSMFPTSEQELKDSVAKLERNNPDLLRRMFGK